MRVLRMKEGDEIRLTDGLGTFYHARITHADPKKCGFTITAHDPGPARGYYLHVAVALTKNADRIEWFVEKATEIGVDEITFIGCQNSERKSVNLDRIKKITVSALKQSQQAWLPRIHPVTPLQQLDVHAATVKCIAHVDPANPVLLKTMAPKKEKYAVLIGPEGDFSPDEMNWALAAGFEKVSLGPNRLRTETAALVAVHTLACINL